MISLLHKLELTKLECNAPTVEGKLYSLHINILVEKRIHRNLLLLTFPGQAILTPRKTPL